MAGRSGFVHLTIVFSQYIFFSFFAFVVVVAFCAYPFSLPFTKFEIIVLFFASFIFWGRQKSLLSCCSRRLIDFSFRLSFSFVLAANEEQGQRSITLERIRWKIEIQTIVVVTVVVVDE